jgi:hypothetical protein
MAIRFPPLRRRAIPLRLPTGGRGWSFKPTLPMAITTSSRSNSAYTGSGLADPMRRARSLRQTKTRRRTIPSFARRSRRWTNGQATGTLLAYDAFNNVTDKWEYNSYDAAPGIGASCPSSPGSFYRHTNTQYVSGSYTDPSVNLVGLPSVVTVDQGAVTTKRSMVTMRRRCSRIRESSNMMMQIIREMERAGT